MLTNLRLENFRGFDAHVVPLRDLTVIVGANNAGKSTVVEALRLVALLIGRFRRGTGSFTGVPDWLEHQDAYRGIQPALRGRGFEGHGPSTFNRYGPPPAAIYAYFSSGASVVVFVGPEGEIHGVARAPDGRAVGTASAARGLDFSPIAIQPQVAPLLREERILADATVRRGVGTYLAAQHFRNQLHLFEDGWAAFKEMAEQTWPGLQIVEFSADPLRADAPMQLHVRDGDFVGEVSLMGHGLQMWLQTMWFLARAPTDATVVLDEPDVYMHPDIQRRLLNLVRSRFQQLIIATHSIEIISDVDPEAILSIDRRRPESMFVTNLPGTQEVIDGLGGVHNIQVTRLFRSRAFLLVEGEDVKMLRILQSRLAPAAPPIDLVPHGELGGRGGWVSGVASRLPTRNIEGQAIVSYCILDRDYFPDEEIAERYEEATRWGVELRIWRRKELENYLLIPAAVARLIAARVQDGGDPPSEDEVSAEIDTIVELMRDAPITDSFATVLWQRDKAGGLPSANREAREFVAARWATRTSRWAIAPGKAVLSRLSGWAQEGFGVSFGPEQVARELKDAEIHPDVAEILRAVPSARRLRPTSGAL